MGPLFFDDKSIKFQNCNLIFVTDAQTDGQTDGRMDKPKAICLFDFSKVGGIKTDEVSGSANVHIIYNHIS